jgi:UDP-glucose 4-epimerase
MLQGTPLTIYGDGTQSRDFTFIANVVQANLLACTAPDAAGGVFNIACGERISLLELVTTLSAVTDRVPEVQHTAPRPGDVPHSQADITRARTVLAYQPSVGLEAGLRETVAALRPS